MSILQPLADGLWSWPDSIKLGPLRMPRRAAIVRLPSGSLWMHSPNDIDDAVRAELDALGPLEHVVAPNQFHHAFLGRWHRAYPDALVHGARGLAAKRPDHHFDRVLGDAADPAWADVLDQHTLGGVSKLNEVVFLHRPSRTLLLTDACFHLGREASFPVRMLMRLNGAFGRLGPTRIFKSVVDDLPTVRRDMLELIDAWDFDRVHVSHGEPVETDAKARLRLAWEQA